MSASLKGCSAVVTGASSGIGEATAFALAAHGARVALVARRAERLETLRARIEAEYPGRARVHVADVGSATAMAELMTQVVANQGRIDILVNAAGVGVWSPALEADIADWQSMLDINVGGVFNASHAALSHLVDAATGERGVADLVNVSSIAGRRVPNAPTQVYSATKFAVNGFSEGLRQELAAAHVRVGLIEPGLVTTEMTTTGRTHAPDTRDPQGLGYLAAEDVADAVLYMVTRPRHAAINEIALRPTEQAN